MSRIIEFYTPDCSRKNYEQMVTVNLLPRQKSLLTENKDVTDIYYSCCLKKSTS